MTSLRDYFDLETLVLAFLRLLLLGGASEATLVVDL